MASLKAIGYWSDPLLGRERWVSPATPQTILATLRRTSPDPLVVSYLRDAHVLERSRGWSWCRLRCGAPDGQMENTDVTDGIWVWPAGLTHYVVVHGLQLPGEFVAHVHANNGSIPALAADLVDMLPRLRAAAMDYSFWNRWYSRLDRATT